MRNISLSYNQKACTFNIFSYFLKYFWCFFDFFVKNHTIHPLFFIRFYYEKMICISHVLAFGSILWESSWNPNSNRNSRNSDSTNIRTGDQKRRGSNSCQRKINPRRKRIFSGFKFCLWPSRWRSKYYRNWSHRIRASDRFMSDFHWSCYCIMSTKTIRKKQSSRLLFMRVFLSHSSSFLSRDFLLWYFRQTRAPSITGGVLFCRIWLRDWREAFFLDLKKQSWSGFEKRGRWPLGSGDGWSGEGLVNRLLALGQNSALGPRPRVEPRLFLRLKATERSDEYHKFSLPLLFASVWPVHSEPVGLQRESVW